MKNRSCYGKSHKREKINKKLKPVEANIKRGLR
jgi:hypothetical protein